jgi:uncharacterized delta-60 repeat protein
MRSMPGRMLLVVAATLIATVGVAIAAPRPGTLDHTFHSSGRFSLAFPGGSDGNAVAMQGHKVVVAGDAGFEAAENMAVIRLRANGKLDRTFGGGDGRFFFDLFGEADIASAVAVLPDEKILVAGRGFDPDAMIDRFVVLRLTANGRLDHTFGGGDGFVTTTFGVDGASGIGMTVLPDGRFVVCGYTGGTAPAFALARYRPGGALDRTFGGTGTVTTTFPGNSEAFCNAVTHVGNQVVAVGQAFDGVAVTSFAVARYRGDGSLAPAFDGDGRALFAPLLLDDEATGVVPLPHGSVVVAGSVRNGSLRSDVALIQIRRNGTLDPAFGGGDGIKLYDPGSADASAGLLRQPDGKLVLVGFRNPDMFVARFRPGGAVDTGFGNGGLQARPWPGPSIGAAAAWDAGAIVVAGSTQVARFAVERLHG